jgi:multidrug efflux pump subunit AcrB
MAKKSTGTKKPSKATATKVKPPEDHLLPKVTVFFFQRKRLTALLWIAVMLFGLFSYTTLLKREGFPSVNVPLAVVGGTYFVNDPAKVDEQVAKPISQIALEEPNVSSVSSQSQSNFFTVTVVYKDGTNAEEAAASLQKAVESSDQVPDDARIQFNVPYFGATGADVDKVDLAVSFYSLDKSATTAEVATQAKAAAEALKAKNLSLVTDVFIKDPFRQTTNPANGETVTIQEKFDQFGIRADNESSFYNSAIIGFTAVDGADAIKLDEQIRGALEELNASGEFEGYSTAVSASYATQIEDSLAELQKVLIEGLLAILIVGSLVIAIRASIITVISLITIVLFTLGFIYLIGFTLNVITLFAIILALALIVDDTIIMVEAIDAARHKHTKPDEVVRDATTKVSRAMVAATATAALCFAPLLFVGGVLGSFIRAIPITIISALIISLIVALVFIPYFARYILLSKKQMGKKASSDFAEGFEAKIANFVAGPMLWARNSKKKLFAVGSTAVFIGFAFLAAGVFIARDVVFNIFPPTKDTNGLVVSLQFPDGTKIEDAEKIAQSANQLIAGELGENFVQSSYFATGSATDATQTIEIISYTKRDVTSPELVDQLQNKFNTEFDQASAQVGQSDVGPPSVAFVVQIDATDREAAFIAANDIAAYMDELTLTRTNGSTANLTNVTVSSTDQFIRTSNKPIVTVSANFDADDTTTLVTLTQNAITETYNEEKLTSLGLSGDAIDFDIGQEEENQESFQTLAIAFPALLVVMYILLAIEFRSFLQPGLIFMAIPFSIFGVMLGLKVTDNAISFFAMLGFFALIGLSIKNTILLTDYSNQARRSGMGAVDAAVEGLRERFRPLFATSATAVVSLIPLAITSPFWEGLAVVLIFGLISSTVLVVTVFPYYYLGSEYLRSRITARMFFTWFVLTTLAAVALGFVFNPGVGMLAYPLSLLYLGFKKFYEQRLN